MHKLVIVVLLTLSVISYVHCRPHFKTRIPEFDGSSIADHDGVFRHDSTQTRKRNAESSNNYLRYEAILIDGIVRIDDDLSIEKLFCETTEQAAKITFTTTSSQDRNWSNETVIVGGSEWGCTQDSQGHNVPFTARIIRQLPQSNFQIEKNQVTFLVDFVPMTELFQHLDLELSMEEVNTIHQDSPSRSNSKRTSVELRTAPSNRTAQRKSVSKRANDPDFLYPWPQDIFFTDDILLVDWINIPGSTLNLIFHNSDGEFGSVTDVDVSGTFEAVIDDTWPADYYIIEMEYNCDPQLNCDYIYSEIFSVGLYPDITFNSPARGHIYTPGDSIALSVEVDPAISITGLMFLSIWELDGDVSVWNTTFNSYVFNTSVLVQNSWVSSNWYLALVEYDCAGEWCEYQMSEFFSVVATESPNSLEFDQPFPGTGYQTGSNIPVTLVADFAVNTVVTITVMQRRLGWDHDKATVQISYPANSDQLSVSIPVQADWEQSRRYYLTAEWNCQGEVCTGHGESQEFSANYLLGLTLDPLDAEYLPDDTVYLSWSSSERYTDMYIQLCSNIPFFFDSCVDFGTHDTNEMEISWIADLTEGSDVWDNFFYIQYNCWFGYLCESTQSDYFRIRNERDVLDWNWDEDNDQPEISEYNFYHSDCEELQATGGYCSDEVNSESPACQLCNLPGFETAIDLTCYDCYAKVGVTVNQMKISISWFILEQFKANLTVNATSEVNLAAEFNVDYQEVTSVPLLPGGPIPIFAYPAISICGFQFYFGVYGTVNLVTEFQIDGNVQAEVSAVAGAAYDVVYDSNTNNYLTASRGTYFTVTNFDMSMQATTSLRVAIVPQVQLSILEEQEAVYINAEPYIQLSLSGAQPPFSALPSGAVPQNAAPYHLFAENCGTQHWLEFGVSYGVLWNGGYNWGLSSDEVTGTLIADSPLASGCLWQAASAEGSSAVGIQFSSSAFSDYDLTLESFQTALVFDISDSLGTPLGAIAKVTPACEKGLVVFDVYFSDTETLQAQNLSDALLAIVADSSSPFYSSDRFVSKSATFGATSVSSPSSSSCDTGSDSSSDSKSDTTGIAVGVVVAVVVVGALIAGVVLFVRHKSSPKRQNNAMHDEL